MSPDNKNSQSLSNNHWFYKKNMIMIPTINEATEQQLFARIEDLEYQLHEANARCNEQAGRLAIKDEQIETYEQYINCVEKYQKNIEAKINMLKCEYEYKIHALQQEINRLKHKS